MCIKQALGELISGKAMRPDEGDIRYPLCIRITKGEVLLLHSCSDCFRIQIVELKDRKLLRIVHDQRTEDRGLENLEEQLALLTARRQVHHVVWIEDHGWEVQSSRMTWQGTMLDLQYDLLEGKPVFPVDEVESSMLYSPVVSSLAGEVWLFSVRRELIEEAKRMCQDLGLSLVRSCIGVASLCRYILDSGHESESKGNHALLETSGGVLLLKNEEGKWSPFGQWPNLGYRSGREGVAMEITERISGENQDLLLFTEKGKDGLTHYLSGVVGVRLKCMPGLVYEAVLWDPPRDVQPDLQPEDSAIRACLPQSCRYLRWLLIALFPVALVWMGKYYQEQMHLRKEIEYEEIQLREARGQLREYEQVREEMESEREKVERLSRWVQQVLPITRFVAEVVTVIPHEVQIDTLSVKSYEGQRQMELVIDPVGGGRGKNLLYSVIMDFLQTRGWRMVSYEQPGEGAGNLMRGVFIHPVSH